MRLVGKFPQQKREPPINHQVKHQEIWSWCCFAIAEVSHDILTHSYIYVWYIQLHEWLIFYGKCRRIYQSHGSVTSNIFGTWMIYDSRLVSKSPNHVWCLHSWQLSLAREKMVVGRQHVLLGRPIFKGYVSFRKGIHMCFVQWFFTWSKPIISYILWKDREVETNKYKHIHFFHKRSPESNRSNHCWGPQLCCIYLTCESPRLKRHLCQNEFIFSIPKQRWTYIIL